MRHEGCRIGGRLLSPVKYHYSHSFFTYIVEWKWVQCRQMLCFDSGNKWIFLVSSRHLAVSKESSVCIHDSPCGQCQTGSLTGAVHLSNSNVGVLRLAQ